MLLSDFLAIARREVLTPEEWPAFAALAHAYWESRLAGQPGLLLQDADLDEADVLIERFTHCPARNVYVHTAIEDLIQKLPGQQPITLAEFERWWALYPRKVAKFSARKSWARLVRSRAMATAVTQALAKQIDYYGWTEADFDPRLIPHPTTWLNQHRWEDEVALADDAHLAGVL
jgi:hypothetical protein